MKEATLLKIAFICSASGIVLLFFLSSSAELKPVLISEAEKADMGKEVKIKGVVLSVDNTDKLCFLKIGQQKVDTIEVLLFKDHDFDLQKGQIVEITGEISDYNGKREIIANRLKVI